LSQMIGSEAAARMTATEAATAIASGKLHVETLARGCLDRIALREHVLKAWSYINAEAVLRQARELDQTPSLGPLHGIPVAIKDVIDTRDMPTSHNSPIYFGHRPATDSDHRQNRDNRARGCRAQPANSQSSQSGPHFRGLLRRLRGRRE
jgi:Asp-tRNA(Asn)/Glu-tRNA(Gln) amidotransferase A subunit family amidase